MSILNIRGTHGSGKSWIVHQLLKQPHEEVGEFGYWIPEWDCGIIGRYSNVCGGCDQIKSANEVVSRVNYFARTFKHVVFEGILVSHTFKRYANLAGELYDFWFLFLDTPLEVCLSRVQARRLERGNEKPLDPTNVIKDWHCVWERVQQKCRDQQLNVMVLNWQNPIPQILEMLKS